MNVCAILAAVRQQISASILPESKWVIATIYVVALLLLIIRLYTGEPYRRLLSQGASVNRWDPYGTDFYMHNNLRISLRMVALITTLLTNLLPLLLPLVVSSFFNRMQLQHAAQQN
ncbi:uncharacterized protein BXIN_2800 [Babesia sp. Xinjiang]|uniref:uncharacterized protein n=1 Tax=Babesia sp. Xinjiang TaxID=462227 RepID=UPI000A266648|nr:uncharacterized protein BXIN_2800 [Babesia sp. Xinjiang]ORM41763.1 hypothetical protein BXIN_2800 [Babesia sp. Xinjiang]